MDEFEKGKCTDAVRGHQLFRRAILPVPSSALPEDLAKHATECPFCSKNLDVWKKKGYVSLTMTEAQRIASDGRADTSQLRIRSRQVGSRRVFFKKVGVGNAGIMVVTDLEGRVIQITDTTSDEFDSLG